MSNIQGLIPVNHKQGKQTAFFQTYKILNLPYCMFVDLQVYLNQKVSTNAAYNAKMQDYTLNTYCKVFGCSEKLDMDHMEARTL